MAGVSITLKNSYDGATSDSLGNFSFTSAEKGKQIIEASIVGYRPFSQEVTLVQRSLLLKSMKRTGDGAEGRSNLGRFLRGE